MTVVGLLSAVVLSSRGRLAVKVAAGRAGRAEQQPPGAGPRSDTTAIDRAVGVVDVQVELRLVPRPPSRCRGLAVEDQNQWSARSAARTYDLDCDLCAARECPARGGRSVRFARSRSSGALRRGLLPAGAGVLTWWRRRARRAPARQGLCLSLIGVNPIHFLVFAAVFNGIAAVPLIWIIDRIAADRGAMGAARSGWLSRTVLMLTFVGMVSSVAAMAVSYVKGGHRRERNPASRSPGVNTPG